MKLTLDGKFLNCNSGDCPFRRECAQHETAGDFRSEGGFSPVVEKQNDDYICLTRNAEVDFESSHGIFPDPLPPNNGYVYISKDGTLVSWHGPFEGMQ